MYLSYIPTAEMLANCFTKQLPKPALWKQCAVLGMIGIGLQNGLTVRHGNAIRNAIKKSIYLVRLFRGDPGCLIGSSSGLFSVLYETDVLAILEEYGADWMFGYHYTKDYHVTCHFRNERY
jgi:hypothetical protein